MLQTTPEERLALGVVALLLSAGAGARVLAGRAAVAEWQDPAAAADTSWKGGAGLRARVEKGVARQRIASTPLAPGERLDPNRAGAEELERLPRVGPALARRIVEWRETRGAFRSLADLDQVPGVGPALLQGLAPHLTLPPAPPASPGARAGAPTLDVNRASAQELEQLPGVGPALAARIVEWRRRNGPFRSLEQLEEVPGIGPALRARLSPYLRAGP